MTSSGESVSRFFLSIALETGAVPEEEKLETQFLPIVCWTNCAGDEKKSSFSRAPRCLPPPNMYLPCSFSLDKDEERGKDLQRTLNSLLQLPSWNRIHFLYSLHCCLCLSSASPFYEQPRQQNKKKSVFSSAFARTHNTRRNLFITVEQEQHKKCIKQYVSRHKSFR